MISCTNFCLHGTLSRFLCIFSFIYLFNGLAGKLYFTSFDHDISSFAGLDQQFQTKMYCAKHIHHCVMSSAFVFLHLTSKSACRISVNFCSSLSTGCVHTCNGYCLFTLLCLLVKFKLSWQEEGNKHVA